MKKYLDYMYSFSQSELKGYLGNNIVDLLVEWMPNGDSLLTKQRMIRMIDCLYGTNILKNKNFRRDLLLAMEPQQIDEIRDKCLEGNEKSITEEYQLVEVISNKPWNKNRLTQYLLRLWDVEPTIFDKKTDDSVVENVLQNDGERFFELLDYQYYIKQRTINIINSGNQQERLLIHMPTGTGKTKTAMHTITSYLEFNMDKQGLVIWIAHTTELLQQAYETFCEVWKHLGDGDIHAYKLWGAKSIDKVDEQLNGIVFCGLSKLMSIADTNPVLFERLHRDARLIVFDEAHKAAATKTQRTIENLMRMPAGYENRALIGLTATPGRTTEDSYNNNLLSDMFGEKLVSIDANILNQINMGSLRALNLVAENNIIKYFQERKILAKMKPERLEYQKEFTPAELKILGGTLRDLGYGDKEFTSKQLEVLATNKSRNKSIMQRLRQLHADKIPTIVFACSVDHAKMISAMLTLEDIPNCLVVGDMDPMDRKKAIDTFKDRQSGVDIIINYEVLTTGFDSKNIRCVFITRPTKSIILYSQMLGRGLRGPMMGGNEKCLLIDVEDNLTAFDNETAFSHFNDYWRV